VPRHRYEVAVAGSTGQLSALSGDASPVWRTAESPGGATLSSESEVTQAQLFAIIDKVHEQGLSLVSVRQIK
jgi:hypothetical protein